MELNMKKLKQAVKKINDFMDFMITGGVPERKECDCNEMTGFLCHLHDMEMRPDNVANRY